MELTDAMEYLAENKDSMLDLTTRLAEINSGSFNISGLERVAKLLQAEFAGIEDCEQEVLSVPPMTQINLQGKKVSQPLGPVLRCWMRPQAPFQVLLVGHMDTVYPANHAFQKVDQPKPGILHGPGVADMKGGIAVMFWALKAFEQLPIATNIGWEVILNSDEEVGSIGSTAILQERAKHHNLGFVFEPAMDEEGTLAGQRKGNGEFTLVMHGKAAHAGRKFAEGRNAITKLATVISRVDALNGQRDGVTINVGLMHGGGAINVVPDCCIAKMDVRIPKEDDAAWVQEQLNIIIKAANDSDYKLELYGNFKHKPKILTDDLLKLYQLVQKLSTDLGHHLTWQPSGGCCDGNTLSALGLLNVDTLGVRGGNIHSQEEYLVVASLVERAQLLMHILAHLSTNGFK